MTMPRIDYTGQRAGKLTAVCYSHYEIGHSFWKGRCDCGEEVIARAQVFKNKISSASCENCRTRVKDDLTGRTFTRMTVKSYSHSDEKGQSYWNCRCECGTEKVANGAGLKRGGIRSCGCLHKDTSRSRRLENDEALWNQAVYRSKNGARQRGITWEISDSNAIQIMKEDCHYCMTPPSNEVCYEKDKGRFILVSGIDRVENDLGYIPGNVVPCCKKCNLAKRDMSVRQFLIWVHQVARHTVEPEFELSDLTRGDISRHPAIQDVIELFSKRSYT